MYDPVWSRYEPFKPSTWRDKPYLKESIAKIPIEELRELYQRELEDWSSTDTTVRRNAIRVLKESEVDGDSMGVPTIEDIVEKLVSKIESLNEAAATRST